MTPQQELWSQIIYNELPDGCICEPLEETAARLENLVGLPFDVNCMHTKNIPFDQLASYAESPDQQAVAIFLHISDDLPGWAMFIMDYPEAMILVDLLLNQPIGTADDLHPLACSALSEVGNVVLATLLNNISDTTSLVLRPSVPSVIVDRLATIMEVGAFSVASPAAELVVIETEYHNDDHDIFIRFWLLPDRFVHKIDPSRAYSLPVKV